MFLLRTYNNTTHHQVKYPVTLANTPICSNSIRIKPTYPQANEASFLLMGVNPRLTASILLQPNTVFEPKQRRVEVTRKEARNDGRDDIIAVWSIDGMAHGKTCIYKIMP